MDTAFFVISKLLGALLRPDTWIIVALTVVTLALWRQRTRLALVTVSATLVLLALLAVFPFGNLLLQPIERTYPAQPALGQVDGIIVLGGGEDLPASAYWGQLELSEGGDRYTASLALARRFPAARVLFAGGSGALRDLAGVETSEADLAERFFLEQGVAPERLLMEGRSRNTAENARFGFELAKPRTGQTWVLVTSAFHMPRAMRSFEAAGWTGVVPWPVDYRTAGFTDDMGWNLVHNLQVLTTAVREHVGQIAYRLAGR
jgi:uncharacterized SAM-binding protein YcdF (DUF218 family)